MFSGVTLESRDRPMLTYYSSQQTKEGKHLMQFDGVEPGRYKLNVMPVGPYYPASVMYDGTDVLNGTLVVKGDARSTPMEVTLRDDVGTLMCSVGTTDNPTPAWLLVTGLNGHWSQMINVASGQQASVSVPPGTYKVYAFDRVDGLEYENPDVMSEFEGKVANVVVQANEKAEAKVDVVQRGSF